MASPSLRSFVSPPHARIPPSWNPHPNPPIGNAGDPDVALGGESVGVIGGPVPGPVVAGGPVAAGHVAAVPAAKAKAKARAKAAANPAGPVQQFDEPGLPRFSRYEILNHAKVSHIFHHPTWRNQSVPLLKGIERAYFRLPTKIKNRYSLFRYVKTEMMAKKFVIRGVYWVKLDPKNPRRAHRWNVAEDLEAAWKCWGWWGWWSGGRAIESTEMLVDAFWSRFALSHFDGRCMNRSLETFSLLFGWSWGP